MNLSSHTPKGGICIVAGEPSGDVQAALLLGELKKQLPDELSFWGVGGPLLKQQNFECVGDISDISVMGASEVLSQYLKISQIYKKILFEIQRRCPKLIIVVDSPTTNLKLAERATHLGYRVVYYIPPKVWSHGFSRIEKLKKYTQLLLCILPFEKDFFLSFGINAKFVGNPLFDKVNEYIKLNKSFRSQSFTLNYNFSIKNPCIIGLIPGSRKSEIERLLPLMIDAFIQLNKQIPNSIARVPVAQNLSKKYLFSVFEKTCKKLNISSHTLLNKIEFVENNHYSVMSQVHYAWVCSGTATLEVGLFQTPMSVVYKLSFITGMLAYLIIKVKYVSLVNLCLNREVVPEFLQLNATSNNMVNHALQILEKTHKRTEMIENLRQLRELFPEQAKENAAMHIIELLNAGDQTDEV